MKKWKKEMEKEVIEEWHKNNAFKFDKNTDKKIYSIDTPPPYVNAPVHIGHATTYTWMDMFARYRRLKGYEVLFPLGLDRNGLPIEVAAEKKFKINMNKVSREEFLKKCEELLEGFSSESVETFKELGISFNSWKLGKDIGDMYYTDMEEYRILTQNTFIDLWNKGLIYQAKRINNYCPAHRTTIADSEIEYKDMETYFNYIKFKVKETGEELIVGTTRPELLKACKMIIFNPEDERYKHLEGKTAISPYYHEEIKIKAHPYAKMEKGTGLVMMCSFGDYTDVRFFREERLEPLILIDINGRMRKEVGKELEGLKVKEAREKIIELIDKEGNLVKREKVIHRTPISERSKHPIEFIDMPEYYLKQVEFKEILKEKSKGIKFYSEESRKILEDWIDSVSMDWPISRRRVYATEIPLWYCANKECDYVHVPEKGKYYRPWKERCPIDKCPKCGSTEFIGEDRVFDTWFDSSITPLYIGGYERHPEFFEKIKGKISLRPQGKEIIRTWLYYTLLRGYLLTGKMVFKDVWINYHILDEKGEKMSKSKGNVIDPKKIIEMYGAEPFRLWSAFEGNLHKGDFMASYERIKSMNKFLTKLWNISRFVYQFISKNDEVINIKDKNDERMILRPIDKWVLNEMNNMIDFVDESYMNYDFHNPAVKLRGFLWDLFASNYLELVKKRAYNEEELYDKKEQIGAIWVLKEVLNKSLIMLSPIIPMITYKIYKDINGKEIIKEYFPEKIEIKEKFEFGFEELNELNSRIWKYKKDKGMSLKDSLEKVVISQKFERIKEDLKAMHNIKDIETGEVDLVEIEG